MLHRRLAAVALALLTLALPAHAKRVALGAATPLATPPGHVSMEVAGVGGDPEQPVVILLDRASGRVIPIGIGGSEATTIALRFHKRRFERPLTHDLLDVILKELGGEIVKVHIDELKSNAFIGTVFLRRRGKVVELDARSSDAIALALGHRVPIFVAREVVERGGMDIEKLLPHPETEEGADPRINPAPEKKPAPADKPDPIRL